MPEHEGHEGHEARAQIAGPRTADATMTTPQSSAAGQHSGRGRSSTLLDVIDRILDKGIVIDAWVSVGLLGLELLTIEARIVVSSIETYLRYAEAIAHSSPASVPQRAEPSTITGSEPHEQVAEQQARTMLQPHHDQEIPQRQPPPSGRAASTLDGLQQQLAQVILPILAAHQQHLLQAIQPQLAPVVDLLRQRVRQEVQVALEPTCRTIQHELEQALEPVRDALRDQFAQAVEPVTARIQEQVEHTLTGAATGASPPALEAG